MPYCNLSRGCKHTLPKHFDAFHSKVIPQPSELLKEDKRTEAERLKAKAKGKGAKGKGKGKGKGKEKEKKPKRKAEAELEDVGDD